MFHVEAFALSNSYFFHPLVKFPLENNLRKLPVNAELLEFVIKRRSANHSMRPSSKAKFHPPPQPAIKWHHLNVLVALKRIIKLHIKQLLTEFQSNGRCIGKRALVVAVAKYPKKLS